MQYSKIGHAVHTHIVLYCASLCCIAIAQARLLVPVLRYAHVCLCRLDIPRELLLFATD
jgi:hypothetical protein